METNCTLFRNSLCTPGAVYNPRRQEDVDILQAQANRLRGEIPVYDTLGYVGDMGFKFSGAAAAGNLAAANIPGTVLFGVVAKGCHELANSCKEQAPLLRQGLRSTAQELSTLDEPNILNDRHISSNGKDIRLLV